MRIAPLGLLSLSLLSFAAPGFAQQPAEEAEETAPEEGPAAVDDEAAPPPSDTPPPVVEAPTTPPPSPPPPVRTTPSTTSSGPAASAPPTHAARETGRVSTGGAAPVSERVEVEVEEESDGRDVDFIWFELEGGISSVDLIAFQGGDSFGSPGSAFQDIQGTGPFAGLGVGFRVFILSIGARVTYANYQNFDIGNIGGDITLRLPIPVVEPYVRVGAGYAWQGQANYSDPAMSATTVYGWSFDSALGLDIYLANWFTIGAGVGLNLLNMSRQAVTSVGMDDCESSPTNICLNEPGDAVGYQLRGFLQIGFRF
jgi:hypothetical protein